MRVSNKEKKEVMMKYFRMMFGIDEMEDYIKDTLKELHLLCRIDYDQVMKSMNNLKEGTDKYFFIELVELAVDTGVKESSPDEEFLDINKIYPLFVNLVKSQMSNIYEMTPLYIKEDLKKRMN